MSLRLIFPPTNELKKQVLALADAEDKKHLKRHFPFLRLERFIYIYSKLGLLKGHSGLYLLEARSDSEVIGVNKTRRLLKIGKDESLPNRLRTYLHHHGTFQYNNKGQLTSGNGVKVYMIVSVKRHDRVYAKSIIAKLEKDVHAVLRQNHKVNAHRAALKHRGKERFIVNISTVKGMIGKLTYKIRKDINQGAVRFGPGKLVKALRSSTNKKYNTVEKGFIYTLDEPKGNFGKYKKGSKWKITKVYGNMIDIKKVGTKITIDTEVANLALFRS